MSDSEDEDDEARVEEVDESGDKADIKGIPEFWLTALKNHQVIGDLINEKDEEVRLEPLSSVPIRICLLIRNGTNSGYPSLDRHSS